MNLTRLAAVSAPFGYVTLNMAAGVQQQDRLTAAATVVIMAAAGSTQSDITLSSIIIDVGLTGVSLFRSGIFYSGVFRTTRRGDD